MSKLLISRTQTENAVKTVNIFLAPGIFAIVDKEDYFNLCSFNWRIDDTGSNLYAYRRYQDHGETHTIKMHRQIMNCPNDMETHHIDRNSLNNCKSNLLNLTPSAHRFAHGKLR